MSLWILSLLSLPGCSKDGDDSQRSPESSQDSRPSTEEEQSEDEGCPDDPERFEARVWDPVLSQDCLLCHTASGAASGTRLVLQPETSAGWLETNMAQARELALTLVDGESLLLLKPRGDHPDGHGGGAVLESSSTAYAELELYAARVLGEVEDCDEDEDFSCQEPLPSARRLRRLTHREYLNTVEQLFGAELELSDFASDDVVGGFDNNAGALDVSSLLADQYRGAAEAIAESAELESLLPCDPDLDGLSNCAYAFIADFGLQAFRRPLEDHEIERYYQLWSVVVVDSSFEEGLRWVITAMLQSPHFLYRTELGAEVSDGSYQLNSWEIASALSYLFWAAPPDDILQALAAEDALLDPAVRAQQVVRLYADARAEERVWDFSEQWLGLEQLAWVTRDGESYPELTESIREDMAGETRRVVLDAAQSGGSLAELLTAPQSFMTPALASFYGLDAGRLRGPADSEGFQSVDLSGSDYGGLLTQGSLLTTHALPTSSSPIHRGVFVRERFLCDELPDPPANLDTSPPAVDPDLSTRERYAQHASDPACAGCHSLIDPIGFGFEHYDGIGRYRTMDGYHEVDASGAVYGSPSTEGEFYGVFELSSLLAESSDVEVCYIQQWMTYGLGHADHEEIQCLSDWVHEGLSGSPELEEVLGGLVAAEVFTLREGEAGEQDVLLGALDPELPEVDPEDDLSEPEPPDWEAEIVTNDDWGTGYCAGVTVRNNADYDITWEVEIALGGTLSSYWSAEVVVKDETAYFSGVSWNAVLSPGGSTEFGYCVTR